MTMKIMITLFENDVAPRFDLTREIVLVDLNSEQGLTNEKTIVLPRASSEDLCYMILREEVDVVVCGGIEEEFHDYLTWKKVNVIDNVIGPWSWALTCLQDSRLASGMIYHETDTQLQDDQE
jgi:predicted Fe-Mo cluster-binding NifX family protein